MKTVLVYLAAFKDQQACVGKNGSEWVRAGLWGRALEWDGQSKTKDRKKWRRKDLRSCLMFWDEIYRNDLLESLETHMVINSCSAFSRAQQEWEYTAICSEINRRPEMLGQIKLVLWLFRQSWYSWQVHLKEWPSTNNLEGRLCITPAKEPFPPEQLKRGCESVCGCGFVLRLLPGIKTFSHLRQWSGRLETCFTSCPQTCSYLLVHLVSE